ncbi:hypothetical protein FNF29_05393 [Cafeteria roenbergensis]|uniref:Uncharacterized protein n=1 Tax=Cafeteria roenbergensis TaxID=33653 RepID=A0A5A8CAL7_CAFRO|nr:hypothetical protein FNF29_05393 [Cafeteria roenbergensis]|eukprot:KAA0150152.1 hypothetical protein FNF29_05393 [Cafeteria roenbergensis]
MASDDKMIARVFWPTGDELGGAGAPLCGRGWLVGCNLGGLDLCVLAVVPAEVASPGFILDRIAAFWEWHDRAKDGYATAFGGVRPTIVGALEDEEDEDNDEGDDDEDDEDDEDDDEHAGGRGAGEDRGPPWRWL